MRLDQLVDDGLVERTDYADRSVFVADFGPAAEPTVDVADDTVIIVTGDGRQREFALPDGEVRAFNRNGVVTIEVPQ